MPLSTLKVLSKDLVKNLTGETSNFRAFPVNNFCDVARSSVPVVHFFGKHAKSRDNKGKVAVYV